MRNRRNEKEIISAVSHCYAGDCMKVVGIWEMRKYAYFMIRYSYTENSHIAIMNL